LRRLTLSTGRHDPFWDVDGAAVRRSRIQRRLVRYATWLIAIIVLALVAVRLPAIDPEFVINGGGRPILAGTLLVLLAASVVLAVAKFRSSSHL
jgi:hypothetical protein